VCCFGRIGRTGVRQWHRRERARVCDGLGFLRVELDEKRNLANEGVISSKTGRISVRVIRTDEEWMIASMVCRVLDLAIEKERE
jgi:acetate kinase